MNKTVWTILILGIVIVGVAAAAAIPTRTLEVPSSATHEFEIDVPMQRVRKILVRTNAVKKIVAMADAKLLDQEWLNLDFDIDRPILKRDWHVDGSGQLIVQTNDAYLGTHDITLKQSVDIKPDRLYVENDLDQPSGPIREYHATIELVPGENGNAKVKSSLDLMVSTSSSWLASAVVERSIKDAAMDSLEKQEQAIREIVEAQADKLIVLPEAIGQ
jgi:hypothetical protein